MPERPPDDASVPTRSHPAASSRRAGYLDFEFEIGAGQGREYPLAVIHSPAGQARETMVFPYDEINLTSRLQDLQVALLRSGGPRRQMPTPEEAAVQRFGRDIFDALLTGEARSLYDMSVQRAREEGKGLRLKLRILPPELARLPWEYLYDDRHAEYVCLSRETPVVRFLESHRPIQPLAITPPLRVLGMISSPTDLPALDTERERQRVEQALSRLESMGLVELTWLAAPTWRELQRAMRAGPWHVFHFVGHGGFDRTAGEGMVAFADEDGQSHNLSATELGRLLADHNALRLAVLNSCEGATSSDRDVFSSTAAVLVRRGIPAVLAMQYEITDRAAIEFARTFYESLADGFPVDGAVAEARKAVSLAVTNSIEWGTPVLFMRTADGVVFELPEGQVHSPHIPPPARDDDATARLDALYTEGLSAFWIDDWERASQRFREIITIRPGFNDAAARLAESEQRLGWMKLRDEASSARDTEDWATAIAALERLEADDAPFDDVETLLADARRRRQIAELLSQARQLQSARHWPAAVNVLTELRELAPEAAEAADMLQLARAEVAELERIAHLDELYGRAVRAIDRGDWELADEALHEVISNDPDYREAAGLMLKCDTQLRPRPVEQPPVEQPPVEQPPVEQPPVESVEPVATTSAPASSATTRRSRGWLIAGLIAVVATAGGLLFALQPNDSGPTPPFVDAFDDPEFDGRVDDDLWSVFDGDGEAFQANGGLHLSATTENTQAGIWVDGYAFDLDQSFDLAVSYRLDAARAGGLVAVEIGPAGCILEPNPTRDVHALYCHAGVNQEGGYRNEIGPFEAPAGADRVVRIRYSSPDRTFVFALDETGTGHATTVDDAQLETGDLLVLRVHDIADFPGEVAAFVDWVEFRHLADDEVSVDAWIGE